MSRKHLLSALFALVVMLLAALAFAHGGMRFGNDAEMRVQGVQQPYLDDGQISLASNTAAPTGKAVFQKNCTNCHGANGKLIPAWLPNVKKMTHEQVMAAIRKGGKGMPSFSKKLSDAQIEAVATYSEHMAK